MSTALFGALTMTRVRTAFCLALLAGAPVACNFSFNVGAPPGDAPVAVSAAQLAQEFHDGGSGRYARKTLEVSGVVGRLECPRGFHMEPGPEDVTSSVVFLVPVTDKQGAKKEYMIRCLLRPHLTPAQRQAAGLAKGKEVTLRGQTLAVDLNNPQGSLQNCTLVGAAR
jgi:hypothetical protein